MPVYSTGREGLAAPATPAPIISMKSIAGVQGRLIEMMWSGESGASGYNRHVLRRSTTDGVTPTAQTPAKLSPTQQAAACTAATAFSTNPTYAAAPGLLAPGFNTFGGVIIWHPAANSEIYVIGATAGSDEISLVSATGANVVTGHHLHEEL